MARRSSRQRQRNRERDLSNTYSPTNRSLRLRAPRPLQRVKLSDGRIINRRPTYTPQTLWSDRRRWHPDRHKPIVNTSGSQRVRISRLPFHMYIHNPIRVDLCIRRKIRRGVMFALGGAGGGRMRKPRRTENSKVRC